MTPGDYYVYGVTNDGTNPQVSDYSSGQITINAVGNQNPNAPTISNYNDGNCYTDTTPELQFNLSDPDGGDQLKYQIQIDDTSDAFASIIVDYTSALGAQGARSFTVGQAAGGGSYATGSEGQTLSDDTYFWRVKAIDEAPAESGWTVANPGGDSFIIDNADPIAPGNLSENAKTSSSVTLQFGAATTEDNFLEYKIFYDTASGVTESDTEHDDSDLDYINYNGTSTTTVNNLDPDTTYFFNIWAYDKCSKSAVAVTELSVTTDTAPAGTSGYRSVGVTAAALQTGSYTGTQTIKVQRGTTAIDSATGTDSPGTAFGSTSSTFVLNQSNRYTTSGRTTLLESGRNIDDLSGGLALTGTNTITFYREIPDGEAVDYNFHWEAWEYIGAGGGADEFIVRDRRAVTLASTASSSYTPSGVSNPFRSEGAEPTARLLSTLFWLNSQAVIGPSYTALPQISMTRAQLP
jgi:hypothetical protein